MPIYIKQTDENVLKSSFSRFIGGQAQFETPSDTYRARISSLNFSECRSQHLIISIAWSCRLRVVVEGHDNRKMIIGMKSGFPSGPFHYSYFKVQSDVNRIKLVGFDEREILYLLQPDNPTNIWIDKHSQFIGPEFTTFVGQMRLPSSMEVH